MNLSPTPISAGTDGATRMCGALRALGLRLRGRSFARLSKDASRHLSRALARGAR
jgi:hypothetical protein